MAESAKRTKAIPAMEAQRVMDLAMGEESSHCVRTPSTWTFAKDYLPVQFEAATEATRVNEDLPYWLWWLRHNNAEVVFTLWTGAVEVFRHIRNVSPLSVWVVPIPVGGEFG